MLHVIICNQLCNIESAPTGNSIKDRFQISSTLIPFLSNLADFECNLQRKFERENLRDILRWPRSLMRRGKATVHKDEVKR